MNEGKSVFAAVAAVAAEIGAVGKDAQSGKGGDQWSYKYRGIESVMNALHPILARHGVTIVPRVVDGQHEWVKGSDRLSVMHYAYDVYGPDGSMFTGSLVAEGYGQRDKSAVIASSYAWRQFVCLLFSIPTEDMRDPEDDNTPVERDVSLSEDQLADLRGVFNEIPDGEARKAAQVEFVEIMRAKPNELTRAQYSSAMREARRLAGRAAAGPVPPVGVDPETGEVDDGDREVRAGTVLQSHFVAAAPHMEKQALIEAVLVRANEIKPDGNKGRGFERWGDLAQDQGLARGLLRMVEDGSLFQPLTEAFDG